MSLSSAGGPDLTDIGSLISSASSVYVVEAYLGCGAYGEVVQCLNHTTNERVALKITKISGEEATKEEEILKKMKERHSDDFNVVRWNGSFTFCGHYCLDFEKLDINLFEFQQVCQPVSLNEISSVLHQLATALQFLQGLEIIHADLKPENVMVVDRRRRPVRVKIIDFGRATEVSKARKGVVHQTLWYRAPEILLGLRFNEAIDVWSLGCIGVELFLGKALFPANSEYDMMRLILNTLGKPPDHMLSAGEFTQQYFRPRLGGQGSTRWRFKSRHDVPNFWSTLCTSEHLRGLRTCRKRNVSREKASALRRERVCFVDLLTRMLKLDPAERVTPRQILRHPAIAACQLMAPPSDAIIRPRVRHLRFQQNLGGEEASSSKAPQRSPGEGRSRRTLPKWKRGSDGRPGRSRKPSRGAKRNLDSRLSPDDQTPAPKRRAAEPGAETTLVGESPRSWADEPALPASAAKIRRRGFGGHTI